MQFSFRDMLYGLTMACCIMFMVGQQLDIESLRRQNARQDETAIRNSIVFDQWNRRHASEQKKLDDRLKELEPSADLAPNSTD
jgi:hypothetical protein